MKFHREGFGIMTISAILFALCSLLNYYFLFYIPILFWIIQSLLIILFYLIIQFFRIPNRVSPFGDDDIVCPADGKVVVIEETTENEYFNDRRIQVSIFMSPLNVHANYYPISGLVEFVKYHKGLFLVAWHPKSSTDNERSTFVVKHANGHAVLFRQIAGALARRICFYSEKGQNVQHSEEFGFIKFGSRVDVFLPLGTKIDIKIGEKVKAKLTRLGTFQ
ncbi:MAG: phosphatidylserine decarboxylase family protein [Crocinitomicaceae bacterium]